MSICSNFLVLIKFRIYNQVLNVTTLFRFIGTLSNIISSEIASLSNDYNYNMVHLIHLKISTNAMNARLHSQNNRKRAKYLWTKL